MASTNFLIIPKNVNICILGKNIILKSNKESIYIPIATDTEVRIEYVNNESKVTLSTESNHKQLGTTVALIKKSIKGLTRGVSTDIHLVGTGYKANIINNLLYIYVGLSHPLIVSIPTQVTASISNSNLINIKGTSEIEVTTFAHALRSLRKPNIYKGTGINTESDLATPKRKTK